MAKATKTYVLPDGKADKNLEIAIAQIEKEFGNGAIMRLGDDKRVSVPTISTGALSLDVALGIGGVPRGRIVEIYGPEASGKTTICTHIIANAQKAGGLCAFIDTEHALDPHYARIIGVDTADILVSQPDCGEDALNIAETLVRSNALDVLVIDSVAALVPRAEIEGQMGDTFVGLQARLMSQALRKLTGAIAKSKTCVIFTNQIREKIGVMFGSPETTPGGRALKFYSSVRLDIRRVTTIKQGDEAIGTHVRARVVKSKISPPFKRAEFDILFEGGISYHGDLLGLALEHGLATKSGSWMSYGKIRLGQGLNGARKFLQDNPDLTEEIRAKIMELHNAKVAPEKAAPAAKKADKKTK